MSSKPERNPSTDFIYLAAPPFSTSVSCIAAVIGWILASHIGLFSRLAEYFFGGFEGDAGIYVWLVHHARRNIFGLSAVPWFDTNCFYPYGGSLAFSDNFILPGLIFSIVSSVVGNDVLAYNLTYLSIITAGCFFVFRLVYALTGDGTSAILSALSVSSLATLNGHLGHPQLQSFFCFPLMVLLILRYLRNRSCRDAFFTGTLILLTFLCSVYYAVFSALLVFSFGTGFILIHPRSIGRRDLVKFLFFSLLGVLPVVFFIGPYLGIKSLFGARALYEFHAFAADPLSYFSFTPFNALYGVPLAATGPETALGTGFLFSAVFLLSIRRIFEGDALQAVRSAVYGSIFVSFAISLLLEKRLIGGHILTFCCWAGICACARGLYLVGREERLHGCFIFTNRDFQALCVWIVILFSIVSLGPVIDPGRTVTWSPFSLLYEGFPGFGAVRAIGRAGIVSSIFLVILFGSRLSYLRQRKEVSPAFFFIIFSYAILENYCGIFPLDNPIPRPGVIDKIPDRAAALLLPYAGKLDRNGEVVRWGEFARLNVYAMNWFSETDNRILNGFSGQKTKIMRELPRRLDNFPDDGSLREIASFPALKYIVVVPSLMEAFDRAAFEIKLSRHKSELSVRETDAAGNYLIEYIGSVALDPRFVVKLPGSETDFRAAFSAGKECKEDAVGVRFFDADSLIPFGERVVPADAGFHQITVPLPVTADRLGVRRLRFETTGGCTVLLSHL